MTKLKQRLYRGAVAAAVLAVAAVPLSAGAITEDTTINASIGSTISITTSGNVSVTLAPGGDPVLSLDKDEVTVNTNHTGGYTLTLANKDTNTNLVSGGNSISAAAAAPGSPAVLGENFWGFAVERSPFSTSGYSDVDNLTANTLLWAGVPASDGTAAELKSTNAVAVNDVTEVWYGVRVNSAQPNGSYSDIVTYSAVTNN